MPVTSPEEAYFCGSCIEDQDGLVLDGVVVLDRPLIHPDERCRWCGGRPSDSELTAVKASIKLDLELELLREKVQEVRESSGGRPHSRPKRADARPRVEPEFITTQDAAALLSVSERTIRRLVGAGKLKAYRKGRTVRVRRVDAITALSDSALDPSTVQPDPDELAGRLLSRVVAKGGR